MVPRDDTATKVDAKKSCSSENSEHTESLIDGFQKHPKLILVLHGRHGFCEDKNLFLITRHLNSRYSKNANQSSVNVLTENHQ
ncbi:unnamed protein product [Caenorhabditis brenneri]